MKRRTVPPPGPRCGECPDVTLPLSLAGGIALARRGSVDRIYFEIDTATASGSAITLDIDLETPLGRMTLRCTGLVIRTGTRGSRSGIAVHIVESRLAAAEN